MEIKLRQIRPQDGPKISEWSLDSAYGKFFRGNLLPPTWEDCHNYTRYLESIVHMITEPTRPDPIGLIVANNFNMRNRTCHFGGLVEVEFQKKYVGKTAARLFLDFLFDICDFKKVITVFSDEFIIKMHEDLGFKSEGKFLGNGHWEDEYRMAIFKEDWRK